MKIHFVAIAAACALTATACARGTPQNDTTGPANPLAPGATLAVEPAEASLPDKAVPADAGTDGMERDTQANQGCAGVESAKWGGRYSCPGFLIVKARNLCARKIAIEICVEKWWVANSRKMDCGLGNVGAARTLSYWTCDATGRYTIRAREPW